jgi:hypothetical protein
VGGWRAYGHGDVRIETIESLPLHPWAVTAELSNDCRYTPGPLPRDGSTHRSWPATWRLAMARGDTTVGGGTLSQQPVAVGSRYSPTGVICRLAKCLGQSGRLR